MKLKAYAKVNMILNVLGTLPNGYHEVEMLMHAISLCDIVTVDFEEPAADLQHKTCCQNTAGADRSCTTDCHILGPQDFKYGTADLAYRAALLMAECFRPDLICNAVDSDGLELSAGIFGVQISIEKHIPAAAGLAGGSADAAAVMIGLAKLWQTDGSASCSENEASPCGNESLLRILLSLGAKLGSDIPFCIAAQLGHPASIARGTGTELEFTDPVDCAVTLCFSDRTIPNKTAAVYKELKDEDCQPRYDIPAFLAAETVEDKRALMGNHLQPAAERLFERIDKQARPKPGFILCGAGPTCFTIGEQGLYRTVV